MLKDGAREGGEPPAAATSLVDGFSVQQELVGGEACHERPEGVCLSHMDLSHPPERPPGGIVAKKKIRVGTRANSLFGSEGHSIRGPCGPRLITCYLNCYKVKNNELIDPWGQY